jgi:hypothetical protein
VKKNIFFSINIAVIEILSKSCERIRISSSRKDSLLCRENCGEYFFCEMPPREEAYINITI